MRAVYELARHYGKGPLQIKQISERQDIPPRYLEQLLHRLKKGGIITSIRGPSGGYELSDDPVNLSVGDIFRILEGPFHMAGCVQSVDKHHCSRNGNCISNQLWSKVQRQFFQVLDDISLLDLTRLDFDLNEMEVSGQKSSSLSETD